MKSKALTLALLSSAALIGYSNTSSADACYNVGGTVVTENATSTVQTGTMNLTLTNADGVEVFNEAGVLVGNITGADGFGTTILSHRAQFPQGNVFWTSGDVAQLVYPIVRATLPDGTPCSFWIHETISNIKRGTRLFGNVTSAQVFADGYISNCPNENENQFELSGEICTE